MTIHFPTSRRAAVARRPWMLASATTAVLLAALLPLPAANAATAPATAGSPMMIGSSQGLVTPAAASVVGLPRTARAVAEIDGWKIAGSDTVAEVWPEVGSVKSGRLALGIDAPVLTATRTAAETTVAVQGATSYTFEAYVRVMSKTAKSVSAWFAVGGKAITLPTLNASWKLVTGTVTTPADATSAAVAIRVSKSVRGLSVDALKLYATADPAKTNLLPNGSFESVTARRGIVNTSLVMTTPTAALAVAMPTGRTTWEVSRSGKRVKSGAVTSTGPITAISLSGVAQGYYTLKVRGSDGRLTTTQIAIVDSPNPWVAQDRRFGVALHVDRKTYDHSARYTRALGIGEIRNDIHWRYVEKTRGVYDFSTYDRDFAELRAQGLGILGIVGYGNPAYGKSNAYAPITSTAISAYAKYAAASAKRYPLTGIEVYNEFNHKPKNLSSCISATCYLRILRAVDSAVGKVKPSLPIVAGATARYDAAWFNRLWQSGGIKYANAVSFHPYEITGAPEKVAGLLSKARSSMRTYGKTTKPIWITELGTSSRTGNRTPVEQASVLVRTSVTAFANGARKFYWYDLINDSPDRADQESNFGLYSHPRSGVAAVAPKQAGFNQVLTITQLGGRSFRASEKLGTGVVSHAFGTSTNLVRVVWAPSGTKVATIKTSKPVVVVDFNGVKKTLKPSRGVVKIKVTKNPVFVRSGSATAGVTR